MACIIATCIIATCISAIAFAAEPLPIAKSYWNDPAFTKSFNGTYRIEAKIEPQITTAERGVLLEIQKLMADEKRDAAIKLLQANELTKKSAALTFNLANLQFENGDNEKAITAYQSALKAYPSFRRAHSNLALAYVRDEKWTDALDHLTEAIRLGDSSGTTYGLLGYCRLIQGEIASALQSYRMAKVTEPNVPEWSAGIAQCLQQLDQKVEAIALLDEVVRQRPMEASYSVLKAQLHLQLNQHTQATKSLELPYRLGILSPEASLQLADLHLRAQRDTDTLAVIENAFSSKKTPPSDQAILQLIQTASIQKKWSLVENLFNRIPSTKQDRSLRLAKANYLIASDKDPAAGATILKKLTAEEPTDGKALLALAQHLAATQQPMAAALQFERATVDPATKFDAFVGLSQLHADQQHYRDAISALDQALKLQSDDALQTYRQALQRIVAASE